MKLIVENFNQSLGLAFAHKALIDKHAGELIANGPVQQKGQSGRVNPARKRQQNSLIANFGSDLADGFFYKGFGGPGGLALTDLVNKIAN